MNYPNHPQAVKQVNWYCATALCVAQSSLYSWGLAPWLLWLRSPHTTCTNLLARGPVKLPGCSTPTRPVLQCRANSPQSAAQLLVIEVEQEGRRRGGREEIWRTKWLANGGTCRSISGGVLTSGDPENAVIAENINLNKTMKKSNYLKHS